MYIHVHIYIQNTSINIHIIYFNVHSNHVCEMYKHSTYKILFTCHGSKMYIHRMSNVMWDLLYLDIVTYL